MQTSVLTMPGIDADFLIRSAMERIRQLEAELRRLQHQTRPAIKSICVFNSNRLIKVSHADILYIKAESNYSRIHLLNGSQYFTSRTLKSWIDELPEADFLRCHRSFLINRKEITEIDRHSNEIVLNGDIHIPSSRRSQRKSVNTVFHKNPGMAINVDTKPDCTIHKLTTDKG